MIVEDLNKAGKYQIILADPPWGYKDKMKGHSFSLDHEYETQSKTWITSLPVNAFCERDCVLFLWAVSPQIKEALDVISAWGFKYKTIAFCWSKVTVGGKYWVSNLGRWTMGNVELCFLATKGKPQRTRKDIKQLVLAERTMHSAKPPIIRERIVELMGDLPRIELFAREETTGWDAWGFGVGKSPQQLDLGYHSQQTKRMNGVQVELGMG